MRQFANWLSHWLLLTLSRRAEPLPILGRVDEAGHHPAWIIVRIQHSDPVEIKRYLQSRSIFQPLVWFTYSFPAGIRKLPVGANVESTTTVKCRVWLCCSSRRAR